jgi:hypothetical protein
VVHITYKNAFRFFGVAALIAIFFAFGLGFSRPQLNAVASEPSNSQSQAANIAEAVPDDFVIDIPRRENNQLNSDGANDPGNAEAFRDQIAEQAKRDPLTLFLYYQASPLGEKKPLTNEAALAKDGSIENGNIYSEQGVQAYKDWLPLWEITDITATSVIKFQAFNTSVNDASAVQSPGVGGDDKSGYDITYRDAEGKVVAEHSALNRCTQPTMGEEIPNMPHGTPDFPPTPPETPETPTPPTTDNPCPPGNENPLCAPKSGDKEDYEYPAGKPPVASPTTPAEITPPPVVSEQPGGGGVVDTPTNPPGSESGVPAPSAEPAPPVRDTPPNEGTGSGSDPTIPPEAPPGDGGGF